MNIIFHLIILVDYVSPECALASTMVNIFQEGL